MDEKISVKTPEFVSITFQPAGLGSRAAAFIIDQMIIFILHIILLFALLFSVELFDIFDYVYLYLSNYFLLAIFIILIFIIQFGYFIILEFKTGGRTIGKRLVGIRVVQDNGHSITFLSSFIRNTVRLIDALPVGYFIGLVMIFAHAKHKRLGDIAAGTIVVHERKRKGKKKIDKNILREINRRGITKDDLSISDWALQSIQEKEWKLLKAYSERFTHLAIYERDEITRKLSEKLLLKMEVNITGKSNEELENMLLALYLILKEEWEYELS